MYLFAVVVVLVCVTIRRRGPLSPPLLSFSVPLLTLLVLYLPN